MPPMRNFEAEALAAVRSGEHRIAGLFHHRAAEAAPQTPAFTPAKMEAATAAAETQEDPMSIANIEADLKTYLVEGTSYVKEWVAKVEANAPAIIAGGEALAGDTVGTIVEAVAGRVLPAEDLSDLAAMVKFFVDRKAVPAPAAPAQQAGAPVVDAGQAGQTPAPAQ